MNSSSVPSTQEVTHNWNTYAEGYSQIMEKAHLQLGLSVCRMLQLDTPQTIFETGCGSGIITVELLKTLPDNTKYTSLAIAEEMIKLSEQRKRDNASKLNKVDHKFIVGDAENLASVSDESVDVYLSFLCIQLTHDPAKALKEAMRVLKKGGKIGITVLGNYEWCEMFNIFEEKAKELKLPIPDKRSIFRFGDRESLAKFVLECGFEVDYCWMEKVTMGAHNAKDLEVLSRVPNNHRFISQLGEEDRVKLMDAVIKEFEERRKQFKPLQNDNVLLIGRKPQ